MSDDTYADLAALPPGVATYYERMTSELAADIARDFIEEWSYDDDPHGFCHTRPVWMRLLADLDEARRLLDAARESAGAYARMRTEQLERANFAEAECDALAAKVEAVRALCDRADAAAADPEVIKMSWADSRTVAVDDLRVAIGDAP